MKRSRSTKGEIWAIAISLLVVVIQAVDIVGQKARLPVILTIIAGSFTTGVSAGRLIQKIRTAKKGEPAP